MQHSARKQISIYHYYCDMFCHACWGVVSWEWLQLRGSVWSKSCICSSTTAWRHNVIKPIWVFRQWHFHRQSSQAHRWRNQKLFLETCGRVFHWLKTKLKAKAAASWAELGFVMKWSPPLCTLHHGTVNSSLTLLLLMNRSMQHFQSTELEFKWTGDWVSRDWQLRALL